MTWHNILCSWPEMLLLPNVLGSKMHEAASGFGSALSGGMPVLVYIRKKFRRDPCFHRRQLSDGRECCERTCADLCYCDTPRNLIWNTETCFEGERIEKVTDLTVDFVWSSFPCTTEAFLGKMWCIEKLLRHFVLGRHWGIDSWNKRKKHEHKGGCEQFITCWFLFGSSAVSSSLV